MRILVSGSLAYDRIMTFPGRFADHILPEKIHVLNVCFTVDGLVERFGGTAGNIAYNLALLEERPVIIACVGRDFGRYRRWLDELGLPLEGIRTIPEEFTASAYITTDQADNQITGFNPGAMKYPADYPLEGLDPADTIAIVSPGNLEDMQDIPRQCKARDIPYICDPGQQIPIIPPPALAEMIQDARLLISNDYELEMICKAIDCARRRIPQRCQAVITTLGEEGSLVVEDGLQVRIPAVEPQQVADPTGAGDAYRAGLIKGLVMGRSLVEAARMGAVAASFAVECLGTQEHRFTPDEFWERHRQAFGRG